MVNDDAAERRNSNVWKVYADPHRLLSCAFGGGKAAATEVIY